MDKIEAIAAITDKGDGYGKYIEWNDSILRHGLPSQTCLYTEDAFRVVAETVLNAAYKVAWNDEAAEAVSNIDIASLINQLKGHIPKEYAS